MQTVGAQLQTLLESRDRDLIWLFEIYASDYDPTASGFDPRDALETFSSVEFTLPFGPTVYRREVLSGSSIHKTTGKEFNSITVRFSNVSRYMADFVLTNTVEEMRLVARVVSRSVATAIGNNAAILSNSMIEFVGRCRKPDGFNRETGTITATPDMGTIAARIPARVFQIHCPLDFKGPECLGYELLSEKSAAYQAAVLCNKLKGGNCTDYENTEFFQGTEIIQITSSFTHRPNESFWKKVLNVLPGISRKSLEVNNSLHDGTPYGQPIPLIFGRWFKQLLPLQYRDIGTSINFLMAACRGKISDFVNIRTDNVGFTQPLGLTKHRGEYGGDGSQTPDTVFPGSNYWSRLAYITGYVNGTDIEVEDPAPIISAVIAGIIPDGIYFDVDRDGTGKLSAGTGGVASAGTSVSDPGSALATFDAWIESRTPEARWKLYELDAPPAAPNSSCTDSSGNSHNGTLFPNSDFALVQGIDGPVERNVETYGMSGGIARIPNLGDTSGALTPSGTQLTIACFAMKGSGGGAVQTMISHGGDTVDSYIAFGQRSTGSFHDNVVFTLELEDDTYGLVSQTLPDDVWLRIICVRDGSFMGIYINGCLSNSRTDLPADSDIQMEAAPWRLGYMTNLVFGAVNRSSGLSEVSLHPDMAFSAQDAADDYASAILNPIGCPGEDWTDNPVDHARYILTEPSLMNNDDNSIDDYLSAYAAAWNCGAVRDDTNAERCLLADTESSRAGVDYRRYYSTGLLGPQSFETTRTQIPAGVPARECEYEFFDPDDPPTSLDTEVVYRKRYTHNVEVSEARKSVDFLYDVVFPTYRGFLRWNVKGQTIIDSERPADWTKLHSASIVGAPQLIVADVLPWKNILGSPYLLDGKVHIDRQIAFVYDNANLRIGATGFAAGDVGKYATQKDNHTTWRLTATTPTWTQITTEISEVREVTVATYSALGDAITLTSSASGGPSAVASGATLSGGSSSVQSSATVTITGSLAEGASITVTINGEDCVLDLVEGESSTTIGHRMACVINATPEVNGYVEAHASTNVVTIKSKIGVLMLSSALEEAHDINTEITRVMAAFAGKGLTCSDSTRANYLDGTFAWPEGSRQSLVNQIKTDYREAARDFGSQPLLVNDYVHQGKTKKANTFEIDLQAVDNYNQAARLTNGLLNKFREGDFFYRWASAGAALLLDEGDVVCVSDASGPFRNKLCRIEDIEINDRLEVGFVARRYSRLQLSDAVAQPAGIQLPSGTSSGLPPPDIAFNVIDFPPNGLIQATDGTAGITSIRGGVIFGSSPFIQWAKVRLIKRGGVTVDESINDHLERNEDLEGVFETLASVDGLYTVQVQACNQWGCSAVITANIIIGFGSLFAIAKEGGVLFLKEGGVIVEKEHA